MINALIGMLVFAAIMAVFLVADAHYRARQPKPRPPVRTDKASPLRPPPTAPAPPRPVQRKPKKKGRRK